MTADNNIQNYQQLENIHGQENGINILPGKIFRSLSVCVLTCWLVFASLCILDFTGYNQNCISMTTFLQSLPILIITVPVSITDISRRELSYLYISIVLSVIMIVIEFFAINSINWQSESIKTGCDSMTELVKGMSGAILGIFSYRILIFRRDEEIVIFD